MAFILIVKISKNIVRNVSSTCVLCAFFSLVGFTEIVGITKCHANRLDVIPTSQVKEMCNKPLEKHLIKFMKTALPRHAQGTLFSSLHASIYFHFHFYGLIISSVAACVRVFLVFFFGWMRDISHMMFINQTSPIYRFISKLQFRI